MNEINLPEKAYKNLDFLDSTDARIVRILCEYLEPLSRMRKQKVNSSVLFFGSSKVNSTDENSPLDKYYQEAEELSDRLVKWAIDLKSIGKDFVICTGGGPGLMEAANRGANRAGGKSIGMNISIPIEQDLNPYISPELSFIFHYFFMRKFWLAYMAKAIIAFPGGYGTMDEIFEILTLVQTQKVDKDKIAILFYGEEYWREIIDFDALLKYKTILPEDLQIFSFCSEPDEAFSFLKERLTKFI
jgi:uncharacterized protein (TIGR00730 family)